MATLGATDPLAVTQNQPWLHARTVAALTDAEAHAWRRGGQAVPHTETTAVEQDHGRLETWRVTAVPAAALLVDRAAWTDLASVVRVAATRQRVLPGGGVALGCPETRYSITSLAPEAARLGAVVRRHWGIENRYHWTLDVSFHEDACRIRTDHAPENLALIRKVALALLRQDCTHTHGLTSKRLRAGWDHAYCRLSSAAQGQIRCVRPGHESAGSGAGRSRDEITATSRGRARRRSARLRRWTSLTW